jgi:hypothetical protein
METDGVKWPKPEPSRLTPGSVNTQHQVDLAAWSPESVPLSIGPVSAKPAAGHNVPNLTHPRASGKESMAAQEPAAAPDVDQANTPSKTAVAKDRACPYCHQKFTSSSLGRHLDLYIKEKNPKPPDGIHDVEAIRRSRGNITRRQARNSTKREASTPASEKQIPSQHQESPYANGERRGYSFRSHLNSPTWQATVRFPLPPARAAVELIGRLASRASSTIFPLSCVI